MKRTLSLVSLLLCILLLFTGCSKGMTFAQYYKDYVFEDNYPALDSVKKVSALSKMTHVNTYGKLIQAQDDKKVKFYNVEQDKTVLELDRETFQGVKFFSVFGHQFFAVAKGERGFGAVAESNPYDAIIAAYGEEFFYGFLEEYASYFGEYPDDAAISEYFGIPVGSATTTSTDTGIQITIYNASGESVISSKESWIDSLSGVDAAVSVCADLFQFGSRIYRVAADGTATELMDNPFFGDLPAINAYTADFYYVYSDTAITVYDKNLVTTYIWSIPHEEVEDSQVTLLAGNRLLVQYMIPLPDSESKYDLLADELKYDLVSLIVDAKNKSVKSVNLDYILSAAATAKDVLISWDFEYQEHKDVDTFAIVYLIEDQHINVQEKYVSINSANGKLEFEIFSDLQGRAFELAQDRYRYRTYSGDEYLMDASGKIITQINGLNTDRQTNSFIAANGKLYNYDLEMVYDYEKQDLTIVKAMGHSVLFSGKEGELKLFTTAGEAKALPANTVVALSRSQFFVLQGEKGFSIYAEDGTRLGSELDSASVTSVASGEDYAVLMTAAADGTTEYYRLFIAPTEEAN